MEHLFEKLKAMRKTTADTEGDSSYYLITGLGNPGREYEGNRHNVGFMVLNEIAKKLGVTFSRVEHRALIAKTQYQDRRILLAKPQTFMNLSGQAVGGLSRFYKVPLAQILIIYDDVDLDYEAVRLRPSGGTAGQKGMKSITEVLGTQEFPRLRVGIGRPPGRMKTPDYVLQNFSKQQQESLPFILSRATEAGLKFVTDGVASVMNEYNQKPT